MPRGKGLLRFRLAHMTRATTATAVPAAPTTMPALTPADRPGASAGVELELDEAPLAAAVEDVAEPPVVCELEVASAAVPEDADVSVPAAAVVES